MPEPSLTELLSPAALAGIDDFSFLARITVEGFLSGLHRSVYQGYGSEFFQYRQYTPGDDLKYIDWKASARRDRVAYTKVFQKETNMACWLVLDVSGSMAYRGSRAPCSKLRYATMAAACLAYLAHRQGDAVGLFAYSDRVQARIPPGQVVGQLRRVLTELASLEPGAAADHEQHLGAFLETARRHAVVVLVSDLLDGDHLLPGLLRRFRAARHEPVVIQVLDPDELDLPFERTMRFVDAETGAQRITAPDLIRERYCESIRRFIADLELACLANDTDFLQVRSSQHLGHTLAAYLHRRESMHP